MALSSFVVIGVGIFFGILFYFAFKILETLYIHYNFDGMTVYTQPKSNYLILAGFAGMGSIYYPQKHFFEKRYGKEGLADILKIADRLYNINTDYAAKILMNLILCLTLVGFGLNLRATCTINIAGDFASNEWGLRHREYKSTEINQIVHYSFIQQQKNAQVRDCFDVIFKDGTKWEFYEDDDIRYFINDLSKKTGIQITESQTTTFD